MAGSNRRPFAYQFQMLGERDDQLHQSTDVIFQEISDYNILFCKLSELSIRADFYQAGWENTITLLPHATYLQNQTFIKAAKSVILALRKRDN